MLSASVECKASSVECGVCKVFVCNVECSVGSVECMLESRMCSADVWREV